MIIKVCTINRDSLGFITLVREKVLSIILYMMGDGFDAKLAIH